VFVAHIADHDDSRRTRDWRFGIPAPNGCFWDGIELTPAANFIPRGIGALFAGHLRHGQPPWTLPDVRSRAPGETTPPQDPLSARGLGVAQAQG
jgi:hypothetical protein